ncbi:MAG: DCC1-like thiol-disulfide oxidoreductase family protein [Verrucomicrobiota bacterium]
MVKPPPLTVASPPPRPLLLYDGSCRFCTLWIQRLRRHTGDFVDYVPSQSSDGAARFPEIPRDDFDHAVQLILPDGRVFHAAEAVCRALANHPE